MTDPAIIRPIVRGVLAGPYAEITIGERHIGIYTRVEAFGVGGMEWLTVPANRRCIGSACMAWRWPFSGRDTDRSQNDDRALGYCGKAGRP